MMTPCAPVLTGLPLSSAASTLSSTMLELARSEPSRRTPTMSGTASSMTMSSAPPAGAVPRYHTCDAHRLPPSSMCHLSPLPRASPTAHCTQRVREPSQHSLGRWRLTTSTREYGRTRLPPEPRTRRGCSGCSPWHPTQPASGPRWRPANLTVGSLTRRKSPTRLPTWQVPRRDLPRESRSRSTAACKSCGYDRADRVIRELRRQAEAVLRLRQRGQDSDRVPGDRCSTVAGTTAPIRPLPLLTVFSRSVIVGALRHTVCRRPPTPPAQPIALTGEIRAPQVGGAADPTAFPGHLGPCAVSLLTHP